MDGRGHEAGLENHLPGRGQMSQSSKKLTSVALLSALLASVLTSVPCAAQPAEAPVPDATAAPDKPPLKPEELDQLLAPIALYPDSLLTQVLMAATYPLEIVQADRWLDANK